MTHFVSNLFGGGSSGGSSSFRPYSPTGLSGTDQGWQTMFQDMMGNITGSYTGTGATVPALAQSWENMQNVLYAPGGNNAIPSAYLTDAMNQANNASNYTGALGTQADTFHNIMGSDAYGDAGAMTNLQNAGNTIWQQATDPNSAIYNNLLNETNQQANAGTSMRGIGMSPEAAGIQQQADQNLNLGWQQQQLQNMLTGIQGMGTAYSGAGQYGQAENQNLLGSLAIGQTVPQLMQQSAQIPLQQAITNAQMPATAANSLASSEIGDVLQPILAMMNSAIPYMNYGSGAQANAFEAGQANQGTLANLASLFNTGGAGSNLFSGLSSLFSSNPFSVSPELLAGLSSMGSGVGSDAGMSALIGGLIGP